VGAMPEVSEVLKFIRKEELASGPKLRALRAVSVHLYLSAQQFRTLALCFPEGEDRQDFFCVLHTRVVDPVRLLGPEGLHSPQLFREQDMAALLRRIGRLHLLNPLHPEDTTYTCNLMVHEERMVVDFLVQLAVKEPGGKVMGCATGARHAALPASWADKGVPVEDVVFKCCYETTNPNAQWRHTLAERYSVGLFGGPDKTP